MKKVVFIILMLSFPSVVFGKEIFYSVDDISLNIHEDWYVFTKDNIENNSKLDELGLDYEEYNNYMTNENIILSGLLFYMDNSDIIEIAIQKKDEIPQDLSFHIHFTNDEIIKLMEDDFEEMKNNGEILSDIKYDIYEDKYKYMYLERNLNDSYYRVYGTIVNGKFYTITFVKNNKYYDYEIYEIEEIVNSIDIKFDEKESIDDSYEVSNSMIDSNVVGYVLSHMDMEDILKKSIKETIIYYIIGGIVGLIAFIIFLIKDKKDDKKFDW